MVVIIHCIMKILIMEPTLNAHNGMTTVFCEHCCPISKPYFISDDVE